MPDFQPQGFGDPFIGGESGTGQHHVGSRFGGEMKHDQERLGRAGHHQHALRLHAVHTGEFLAECRRLVGRRVEQIRREKLFDIAAESEQFAQRPGGTSAGSQVELDGRIGRELLLQPLVEQERRQLHA